MSPASSRIGRAVLALVVVYGAGLLAIGLWPHHVDQGVDVLDTGFGRWLQQDRGLTRAQAYGVIEGAANVVLYVPFGAVVAWALERSRWWGAVAAAAATSGLIELLQAVARPGRTGAVVDVVNNTLGAAVGATIMLLVLRWWQRRARRSSA